MHEAAIHLAISIEEGINMFRLTESGRFNLLDHLATSEQQIWKKR